MSFDRSAVVVPGDCRTAGETVRSGDLVDAVEIGERARDPQHPVIAASRRRRRGSARARRCHAAAFGSLRGNNGSAFFFCLHRPAKSAMAEILVSDLYECRPPQLIGGFFHCHPGITRMPNRRIPLGADSPRSAVAVSSGVQPDASTHPDFRLFRLLCALFFSLLAPVLALAAFLSPSQGLAL